MLTRFLSGFPHGAFFGIGSLVAASMVPKERRTWAVAMMLIGLGAANVVGVPLTTMLGQNVGWQAPYWVVGGIGVVTVLALWAWVPWQPLDGAASMRGELTALTRLQVWLALLIGVVGFGGMFATYSYIAPTMTELSRFPAAFVPVVLAIYGVGMVSGMLVSGRVAHLGVLRGIIVVAQCDRGDAGHLRLARPHPGARPGHGVRAGVPAVDPRARCCRPGSWTSPRTASRWPPR